ncbi:NAD(P)H-dependent oxidoreductase [Nonomuraea sp. MCN248]|uniref:NAD(P)H-dependent oxidoreductase n=1 Tax=Nonomuraea corallina TaxID=2989783 RepID=A0ABT4S6L1_9ACTN|nr:NAD(P)H-dependent oxidoreductase [Nonomuraea corallina]MDA0632836.1 NAD(P)H-dependent oxidoreductase [Nonomuraea corallina]
MIRIGIVIGSTRPGRVGEDVARWVQDLAVKRGDAEYELVDLADFALPHLDEPLPAAAGQYTREHTAAWSERISSFDGFVFVTPEYNHSTSGALKNAIDFLFAEWSDKAAAFVSYGVDGGARAAEHLRQVLGQLKVADVAAQVTLSLYADFEDFTVLRPAPLHEERLTVMLDQLVSWATALRPLRVPTQGAHSGCPLRVPAQG